MVFTIWIHLASTNQSPKAPKELVLLGLSDRLCLSLGDVSGKLGGEFGMFFCKKLCGFHTSLHFHGMSGREGAQSIILSRRGFSSGPPFLDPSVQKIVFLKEHMLLCLVI
jgi:hypothetical protein